MTKAGPPSCGGIFSKRVISVAVMSHMPARALAVLRENKHHDLRNIDGRSVSREEARKIISSKYQVSEEIHQEGCRLRESGPQLNDVRHYYVPSPLSHVPGRQQNYICHSDQGVTVNKCVRKINCECCRNLFAINDDSLCYNQ